MGLLEAWAAKKRQVEVPPLLDWVTQLTPQYQRPEHLAPYAALLERAESEPVRGLVSVAPRHGKTEILLHWFARVLRRHPAWRIAYITYGDSLASQKSRTARDLAIRAGVRLRDDSKSLHQWDTVEGGGLVAGSVNSGLTGMGFNIIVFDDPFKNAEEADSEVIREKTWNLWLSTVFSRLEPGGSALVNAARWHFDDLIGRIEKEHPEYTKINLGALKADGTPLWPFRWKPEQLAEIKTTVGGRWGHALYMGTPSPDSGTMFKREWFAHRYTSLPHIDFRLFSLDGAWKEGAANDFSVLQDWGYSRLLNQYYLIDEWRARVQLPDLLRVIKDKAVKAMPDAVVIEDAASGIGVAQVLKRETSLPIVAVGVGGTTNEGRAAQVSPLYESGRVWLPERAEWVADHVEEFLQFPVALHDDRIAAAGHALRRLSDPMGTRKAQRGGGQLPNIFQR